MCICFFIIYNQFILKRVPQTKVYIGIDCVIMYKDLKDSPLQCSHSRSQKKGDNEVVREYLDRVI